MNTRLRHRLLHRRTLLATVAFGIAGQRVAAQAPAHEDPWPSLAAQIFEGRPIQDGSAVVAIDAPYRAEDAALVPVDIHSLLPVIEAPYFPRHGRDKARPRHGSACLTSIRGDVRAASETAHLGLCLLEVPTT
jgi:hypothetical protein